MNKKTVIGHLSLVIGLAFCALASGCAVPAVENMARNKLRAQGWEVSPRNADVMEFVKFTPAEQLKAGVTPITSRLAITEAANDLFPWLYKFAKLYDYGVLPVGAGLATYGGYKAMSGGGSGNSSSVTINASNGGQVNINHGPGSANQSGPSTTSTSTTSP